MQIRVVYPLLLLLALFALVGAAPAADEAKKPKPSPTPKPPPKPPVCKDELLCCLSATSASSSSAKSLLGLLHINLTPEQKGESVGLTCSTLKKRGLGDACFFKPLCCDKTYQAGLIAIGCKETKV